MGTGALGDTAEARLHRLGAGPLGAGTARLGVARGPLALSSHALRARLTPNIIQISKNSQANAWLLPELKVQAALVETDELLPACGHASEGTKP
jgi:hypothetical protein